MDLQALREQIDQIDNQLVQLFCDRMKIAGSVAQYKKENRLPVVDPQRERAVLNRLTDEADPAFADSVAMLYPLIFELSRCHQNRILNTGSALPGEIARALSETPQLFPQRALVACQGVEGAYSQQACEKLFRQPNIMYFKTFEAVFSAVENRMCQYAVIPVENSTAGSVNMVYDLMMRHNFRIVRSTRLKVDHSLMARPGTKLSDIKEIFSHEQALGQCSEFIKSLGVQATVCENTALAARMVATGDRTDVAAICSRSCADLYGLVPIQENVQNQQNNYTRFICITNQLEIYPGADRTSLMMVLPHRAGALYNALSRLYALGVNLLKLESRPLPDRDFEFMFYFDLESSVYSPQFMQLMGELEDISESFSYLGSYSEVI